MLPNNELIRTDRGVNPFPSLMSIMRALSHGWEIAYTQWASNVTMLRRVVGNRYYWIQVSQEGRVSKGIPSDNHSEIKRDSSHWKRKAPKEFHEYLW